MTTETILTYSAYRQLPENDPNKYEMLWGVLFVTGSPRVNHQWIQTRLSALLLNHVEDRELGMILGPIDLYRDELNYVQPDISFFTAEQMPQIMDEQAVRLVPPLVVEILSPSTSQHDRQDKRRWYRELGVQEYWLVDLKARTVAVIDLQTDTERTEDPVRSVVLPELSLSLKAILG